MATSENGWTVLRPDSDQLYTWNIPTKSGMVRLRLRRGSVGFILAYAAFLWSDLIEPMFGKLLDDWGYAYREVRGDTDWSNHASGTAFDANATRHNLGAVGTVVKAALYRVLLRTRLGSLIRWGGDYHGRKDEMHSEAAPGTRIEQFEALAKKRLKTRRGKALIAANPTQLRVINS